MNIEEYSEKSFVVLGDTKPHKEILKELGGKWNSKLKEGKKGWIFSNKNREKVEAAIKSEEELKKEVEDFVNKIIDDIVSKQVEKSGGISSIIDFIKSKFGF